MRHSSTPAAAAAAAAGSPLPARLLPLLGLLCLVAAPSCTCAGSGSGATPGTGLKEVTWTFRPAPGQGVPPSRALLRYDGTGTLDTGGGAQELTVGPISMAELQSSLEECLPFAGTEQGDPACEACAHATVEVIPARGAPWKLTQHGADSGPAPVKRLFAVILGAVRPR